MSRYQDTEEAVKSKDVRRERLTGFLEAAIDAASNIKLNIMVRDHSHWAKQKGRGSRALELQGLIRNVGLFVIP